MVLDADLRARLGTIRKQPPRSIKSAPKWLMKSRASMA